MSENKKQFSLICTDIDGTLLNADKQLSEETKAAFRAVGDSVRVVLASSRMPAAMRHLQAELGRLHEPLICYNGGYIVSYLDNGSIHEIASTTIAHSVVKGICDNASTELHISLYHKDEWYAPQQDYWAEREARITKVEPVIRANDTTLAQWADEGKSAHKVMCMGPENEIDEFEKFLHDRFVKEIHIYRSRPTYLELAPVSVSKGSGLELLIRTKYSSIGMKEVISFGDNYNDIDLLMRSGHGVAVSNSRKEVLNVANEVTGDSREDGVAMIIRKYFS